MLKTPVPPLLATALGACSQARGQEGVCAEAPSGAAPPPWLSHRHRGLQASCLRNISFCVREGASPICALEGLCLPPPAPSPLDYGSVPWRRNDCVKTAPGSDLCSRYRKRDSGFVPSLTLLRRPPGQVRVSPQCS